nr:PREDICTED: lens fiber membrane intrinsic protein [Equus przewalskii]
MYSFMGGGLFCAWVGTILLVVATATDHWMQYRLSGSFAHQGLWRYCLGSKCYLQTDSIAYWNATRSPAFFVLLALAIYTGVTVSFLGRRFGDWRFSWSYIVGWVALLMTFFAGIFYMCAYRMHECRRLSTPR